jgi:hypothetical protein
MAIASAPVQLGGGRAARPSYERAGLQLLAVVLAAVQFVEFSIVGDPKSGTSITLQRLVIVVALPVCLTYVGAFRMRRSLATFGLLLALAGCAWYLVHGRAFDPKVLAILVATTGSFVAACGLYTVARDQAALRRFLQVLLVSGLLSAVLVVAQSVRFLPAFGYNRGAPVAGLSFVRGTGLRGDPNFAGLALLMALPAALAIPLRPARRGLAVAVLLLGIFFSFSRGALACACIVLLVHVAPRRDGRAPAFGVWRRRLVLLGGFAAALFLVVQAGGPMGKYVGHRMADLGAAVPILGGHVTTAPGEYLTSTQTRAILASTSVQAVGRSPLVGVGGLRTQEALGLDRSITNVVHNSPLELLLDGGLIGALALFVWLRGCVPGLRPAQVPDPLQRAFVEIGLAVALMSLTLSLTVNWVWWIPLVAAEVGLSARRAAFPERAR